MCHAHTHGEAPYLSSVVSQSWHQFWMRGHRENLDTPISGEAPCLSSVVPRSNTLLADAAVVLEVGGERRDSVRVRS
jgi:hypothetical protein